ncbi:MAG: hypothetical protein LBO67_03545 [Spirochaetaceae bacterium]|jgi:hypothetical protein|nr:hypothetical protein [Spirochaetaceae bacterium]
MKKQTKFAFLGSMGAAAVLTAGLLVSSCAGFDLGTAVGTAQVVTSTLKPNGVYVGVLSYGSNATVLTPTDAVYLSDEGLQSLTGTEGYLDAYSRDTRPGTVLYYAAHKVLHDLKATEGWLPAKVDSVNFITFTDGFEQASLERLDASPLGGEKPDSADYGAYIHNRILNDTIKGQHIGAYAVGAKRNDSYAADYDKNLSNLVSDEAYRIDIKDPSQLEAQFDKIIAGLNSVKVISSLTLKVVGVRSYDGRKIRVTFDGTDNAAASQKFVEGTLSGTTLTAIDFTGVDAGVSHGSSLNGGKADSNLATPFTFDSFLGYEPNSDTVQMWVESAPNSGQYTTLAGNDAGGFEITVTAKKTAIVYLLLDANSQYTDEQIATIRQAAKDFVTRLYNVSQDKA